MSITLYSNKLTGYDTDTDHLIFTLENDDKGVHKLVIDTFVTLDSLGELFAAIRAGVAIMDREKTVSGAE